MDTVTKSNPFILKWINEIFGTLYFNWPKNSIRSKSYPKPCLDSSSFQPYWVSAHQCGSRLYTMPKTHINNIGLKTGSCIHSNENDTITFIISLCITWFMAYPSFLTFLFFYGLSIIKELTFWALSLQSLKKSKIGSFGSPRGPIHIYNFVPKMGPRKYFQENGITFFFFFYMKGVTSLIHLLLCYMRLGFVSPVFKQNLKFGVHSIMIAFIIRLGYQSVFIVSGIQTSNLLFDSK